MKRRLVARILAALVLAYAAAGACFYLAMRQPPETFGAIMARVPTLAMIVFPFEPLWTMARQGSLRPGDAAPDLALPPVNGGDPVRLSGQWRDRPVVLVFGSYT